MDDKGTIQIAYLHNENVSHSWVESMRAMLEFDLEHGGILARRPLNMRCGAGMVAHVRNYATRLFLDRCAEREWLLFIDTDMGFTPDAAQRLLEAADPVERPVVGALCFALMEANYDGMGGWRRTIVPTMYRMGTDSAGRPSFCHFGDYQDNSLIQVAGTGAAFLLIHRSVLEKLRAEYADHWWDMLYDQAGDIVGEDIAFCARLGENSVPVHVHTGIKTSHHKELWLAEEDYEAQRAMTVTVDPALPVYIDLPGSLNSLAANEHVREDGMLKLDADLNRYRQIIEATKPDVIVETGTRTGASARWFGAVAGPRVDVITIDISRPLDLPAGDTMTFASESTITFITGDSTDPAIIERVRELVAGRRCMVSLDSDHSAAHVAKEIDLYGPLVTPGCYLVVEDGIFGHAPQALREHHIPGLAGSPLDAIADKLAGNPQWSRDIATERLSPISHHPAGWWVRNG
jgi:cephalosporin hydroxylase